MRSWGLQTLKKVDKSPNEFAMKTVNEYLNETTRPTDKDLETTIQNGGLKIMRKYFI